MRKEKVRSNKKQSERSNLISKHYKRNKKEIRNRKHKRREKATQKKKQSADNVTDNERTTIDKVQRMSDKK